MTLSPNPILAPPAAPPRYGLIAAVAVVDDDNASRWEVAGWTYLPEHCGDSGRASVQCGGTASLTPPGQPAFAKGDPFVVWAADECSTLGYVSGHDYAGRARRQLAATESFEAANELWTGELSAADGLADNVALTDGASDTVTNGPTDPVLALAALEAGMAVQGKGRRGMIHLTPQLATILVSRQAVRLDGNQLVTSLGTIVVPDAGYTGSGPGDVAPGASQWAYGTGLVRVYRSTVQLVPEDFDQAIDRRRNTIALYAERLIALVWDQCMHVAAEVDVAVPLIGGAS